MSSIFRKISLQKTKKGLSNILEFVIKYFGCINKNCIQNGAKSKKTKRKALIFCFFYMYATWFVSSSFTNSPNLLSGKKKDGIIEPNDYVNSLGSMSRDVFAEGSLITKQNIIVDKIFDEVRKNTVNKLERFKIDIYYDDKKVSSIKTNQQKKVSLSESSNSAQNNANQNKNPKSPEFNKSKMNKVQTASSKMLIMTATAYDLSPVSCGKGRNSPNYGITASGKRATARRTIAVDPNVIPLGTCVRIIFPYKYSYLNGVYIAEDTGGAIKGNIIDVFMGEDTPGDRTVRDLVYRFGVQKVQVEILN